MNRLLDRILGRRAAPGPAIAGDSAPTVQPNAGDLVADALRLRQAGDVAAARARCHDALAVDPRHVDALRTAGAIEYQLGRPHEAATLFERAVLISPADAALRGDLALAQLTTGGPAHALGSFETAARLDPASVQALNNLGNVYADVGRFEDAEAQYRLALELRPEMADLWRNLGIVLRRARRYDAAIPALGEAVRLDPTLADAHNDLGATHQKLEHWQEAADCFAEALQWKPDLAEAHCNLGDVLLRLGRVDEAEASCRRALELRPADPDALSHLASVHRARGDWRAAQACCGQALAASPMHVPALLNLGAACAAQGDLEQATRAYRDALAIDPGSASAGYNLAILALLRGEWREGFRLYEKRFAASAATYAGSQPLLRDPRRWWGGRLDGRRILIWPEQGYGDMLMMLRYLPLLKQAGAQETIVACDAAMEGVVRSVAGVDTVLVGGPPPPASRYDVHCPMLSLPLAFDTTPQSVPDAVPYVHVPPAMAAAWNARFGSDPSLRVGVCWAGAAALADDAKRSVALRAFAPLLELPGLRWVSLQKGAPAGEAAAFPAIADWMDECANFLDTAALISALDAVVSVDTAVVHLAGALGRPTWLLNRSESEWRWGLAGSRTPWYPTLTIARQDAPGDWRRAIEEVGDGLQRTAAAR
ncbi:MAG: tetratricopeptide repeat protein [Burkholderiales bacterium]